MCAIAGIITAEPQPQEAWLEAACRQMQHRGPDGQGRSYWRGGAWEGDGAAPSQVALGHQRLAILDLSARGHQPMQDASGRYALTFNGEIYNYLELRQELAAAGVSFQSDSDTEVLLQLLIHHGPVALARCRGMFALCLVDLEKGEFLLARDPFGIKPLYLTSAPGRLAFASEIKALRPLPWVTDELRPQSLYNYLRFSVSDDSRTALEASIRQLPPAHYAVGRLSAPEALTPHCYWKPRLAWNTQISFADAAAEMRALFLASVRLHLRSDVAIGAALSGGIDSSAIVCAMRHLEPDLELHTFTYTPRGKDYCEEAWSNIVSQHTRSHQHLLDFTTEELVADLDRLLEVQEEPFGNTSIYAQHRVFREVSQTPVIVMLDGQGADETLAGYSVYLGAHLASLFHQGRWSDLWQHWRQRQDPAGWRMASLHVLPAWLQALARRATGKDLFPAYLNKAWFQKAGVTSGRLEAPLDATGVVGMLYDTINRSGLPQLLHFEDRNSMAYSIESRVPFLETDFVEFALSLPGDYHIGPDGTKKHIFREAMRGIVPAAILDRKDKIGFQAPGNELMLQAAPWIQATMDSGIAKSTPWLDLAGLQSVWKALERGELSNQQGQGFWRVICYLRWMDLRGG